MVKPEYELMTPTRQAIMNRRAELRTDDESKTHAFHLAAMLMERNKTLHLGFNAFHVALDAEILMRLSKRIAVLALHDCNHGLNAGQEKQQASNAATVQEVASWYELTAKCYGDPRGYVVRLEGDGIKANGWGDGFGVA